MSAIFDCSDELERERGLALAVAVLKRGGLASFAADSSYALACDAFDRSAVAELLKAKGRDARTPVSVLVPSATTVGGLVHQVTDTMTAVVEAFWPGNVTIVARSAGSLVWDLGDTGGTVSIRMPMAELAQDVLIRTGPLAVMSANRIGMPAPLGVAEMVAGLGDIAELDVILDSGMLDQLAPSSIVDLTGERPRLLREGSVTADQLRVVLGDLEVLE